MMIEGPPDPFGPVMLHLGCGREHAFGTDCPTDEPTGHEAQAMEQECTTFGDLARGVRVFLRHDGTRREEPA